MPKKPKPRKPQKIEPLFHPPYEAVRGRVHFEAHKGKEFDSNPELIEIEDKDMKKKEKAMKKKAGLQRHLLALLHRTRGGHMFHEVQKRINGTQESAVMSDQEVQQWYRFVENAVEDAKMSARNNPRGFRYASASRVATLHMRASGNLSRPEPVEFITQSELDSEIQSSIDDVFHSWGSATVEKVSYRDGVAYVRGSFQCEVEAERRMLADILNLRDLGSKMSKWSWRMKDVNSYGGDFAGVRLFVTMTPKGLVLECYASRPDEVVNDPKGVRITRKQLDALKITKVIGHYDDPVPTLKKMNKEFRLGFKSLIGR